jgi:CheY-like chemotaxis protein
LLSGRRKLLLADDSPTIQKVISLTFGDEGVEVVTVGDGESALLALAQEPPPDVLLADVVMPGPDGYELCERVKRDERLAHIPVILLVGAFEPFNEAEARRVGADTVLTKPFQAIRDLVSKVGSFFGGGEPREEGGAAHAHEESAPRGAPVAEQPSAAHAEAHTPEGERDEAPFITGADERGTDPASSFADLGADDELIEARPADAFGASAGASSFTPHAEAPRGFAEMHEPEFHASQPEANGSVAPASFGAAGADVFGRRRQDRETSLTEEGLMEQTEEIEMNETTSSQSSFDARAKSAAAADDALLDLAELDMHANAATDESDDFILDLDDKPSPQYAGASHVASVLDEPAFEVAPAAPAWADAPSAFAEAAHGEQPRAFAEASVAEVPNPFGEQSRAEEFQFDERPQAAESHAHTEVADEPWRDVVMQDGPQGFAFGSETQQASVAPRDFVEPEVVPADEPVPAVIEGEYTDGSVEGDVPKAPAPEMTASAAPTTQEPTAAGFAVGEARAGLDESPRADQLSQEMIDAIARRVVELMSDKAVREIAWEVVPELAELIIRQRLDEEKRS